MFSLLLSVIYLAFIGLGLPDALLGSAWPIIHVEMNVDESLLGLISLIICLGTIVSSFLNGFLTRKLPISIITGISIFLTGIGLIGFSFSSEFWMLCLFAIPYGLGAGSVDACLNNYVALNYKSIHMNFLHCMWGIGASIGPYIMTYALTKGSWSIGCIIVSIIQMVLTLIVFLSIPLWKKNDEKGEENKVIPISKVLKTKMVKEILIVFLCYCALETSTGLWASTYLNMTLNIDETTSASLASLFYIGITFGRLLSGFISLKLNDDKMIIIGIIGVLIGLGLLLTYNVYLSGVGLIIIGLGCAPIYPAIVHSTPSRFGKDISASLIGLQMGFAYIGSGLMPLLFSLITDLLGIHTYPIFLLIIALIMTILTIMTLKNSKLDKND